MDFLSKKTNLKKRTNFLTLLKILEFLLKCTFGVIFVHSEHHISDFQALNEKFNARAQVSTSAPDIFNECYFVFGNF